MAKIARCVSILVLLDFVLKEEFLFLSPLKERVSILVLLDFVLKVQST